jgi:N,N-dimethylformamidase
MMKITGYADKISVLPGETIKFMVNAETGPRYRADIVRVICGDENPDGPGYREKVVKTAANGSYKSRKQVIHAGSFVEIGASDMLDGLESFTMQAFIWPTTPEKGTQAIISKWRDSDKAGAALIITKANGSAALCIGDGKGGIQVIHTGKPLVAKEWYFVAASYDAKSKTVTVVQEPLHGYETRSDRGTVRSKATIGKIPNHDCPLIMGAYFEKIDKGRTVCGGHYNGKIDSPRVANRALSAMEMQALRTWPVDTELGNAVIGAWDFSADIMSTKVTDLSPNLLHGKTVQLPTRAMTGWNWTGDEMNWTKAQDQYGAIHFHDDDIADAGWEVDFELTIPKGMKSGVYAARLRAGDSEDHIPFAVRAPRGKPTAKVCYLMPSASYQAYANEHMNTDSPVGQLLAGRLVELDKFNLYLNEHREYGASCYDAHSDGSGVSYSTRLRPILNMRPKHRMWIGATESTLWQFNADTHITDWLEAMGFDYDVVADEDLHYEGLSAIEDYAVVISSTHPEYHSKQMWDAMDAYQRRGGRLMYMGANGWYWRIQYHPEVPGVIEVRRNEDGIRTWEARTGEYYHSFSGEYGGLWRRNGRPPQKILGVGFTAQGFDISSYYVRNPDSYKAKVKFIFEGIGKDEKIGDFGLIGGGAAGLELDRADRALGTPPDAYVVASSVGHTDIYLVVCEEILVNSPGLGGHENELVRADITFHETQNGGAVWSTGSIAWAGSLAHNNYKNNVSRMTKNVLKRFMNPKPF